MLPRSRKVPRTLFKKSLKTHTLLQIPQRLVLEIKIWTFKLTLQKLLKLKLLYHRTSHSRSEILVFKPLKQQHPSLQITTTPPQTAKRSCTFPNLAIFGLLSRTTKTAIWTKIPSQKHTQFFIFSHSKKPHATPHSNLAHLQYIKN